MDMCKALEDIYEDGKADGKEEGLKEGKMEVLKSFQKASKREVAGNYCRRVGGDCRDNRSAGERVASTGSGGKVSSVANLFYISHINEQEAFCFLHSI